MFWLWARLACPRDGWGQARGREGCCTRTLFTCQNGSYDIEGHRCSCSQFLKQAEHQAVLPNQQGVLLPNQQGVLQAEQQEVLQVEQQVVLAEQ